MSGADEEFLQMLRATFRVEAEEHLQAMAQGLRALGSGDVAAEDQLRVIETIYRAAHSLKGAARAVDYEEIESVCQSIETLFASWKRRESEPSPVALEHAQDALRTMSEALSPSAPQTGQTQRARRPEEAPVPPAPPAPGTSLTWGSPTVSGALSASGAPSASAALGHSAPAASPPRTTPPVDAETVRISVSALDARLLEAEELLAAKLATGQRAADIGALAAQFEPWQKEWSRIVPKARALRKSAEQGNGGAPAPDINALADFLDWTHDYLRSLEGHVSTLRRSADQDAMQVARLVDDLLENSKRLLMLPLATLGNLLQKVVRDLCRDQGKQADLILTGEEVKIDKRILEEMKDPLIHLMRNCVDHGIETPEKRRAAGKPPRATIRITCAQVNGDQVGITVRDDGAGIDLAKVKAAAIARGFLSPEKAQTLAVEAAHALVLEADVSTSPMITQVSGRGLGLAIVREKAEKLGGRVAIESEDGLGTTIRITLPLTMATFRGVLLECAARRFILPSAQMERVLRFRPDEVQTVKGRTTLALDHRAVSLADLADVLQLPPSHNEGSTSSTRSAVVIGSGEQRIALVVDAVLGEREVLVKRLTKPLSRIRNIAGATVLGSGEVVPILNVSDVLKSARAAGASVRGIATPVARNAPARRVLVAEDSITSRMLIKGILEAAGYEVRTASDGMEAFTSLRSEHFDVVVSDVEMPRLDGFNLTARIRADRTLAHLPVVLVTALASREHRERGVDVGANAYLVKSNLDQSDLLATLRRLV